MSSYWPSDLDVRDMSSPLQILEQARQEWTEESSGVLSLLVQKAETIDNMHKVYIYAKHEPSGQTVILFSVYYRLETPYPAKILPRENELPNSLKKSYYSPGLESAFSISTAAALAASMKGKRVTNERVCDSPAEFRSELEDVFNLGSVKSEVISLVSNNSPSAELASEPDRVEDESEGHPDEVE